MAWTLDFTDTFSYYPVTTGAVTALGRWTILNGASSAVTIAEDGLQGIAPQDLRVNLGTTTSGRMVGCRVFPSDFVNGESGLLAILDDSGLIISIARDETFGWLKLYRPGATTTSATAVSALAGINLELAFLADGTNHHWEVRVDGVAIADLTGSAANATTYQLHTISPSRGGGSGVCQSDYSWFWSKTYSGAGGIWASSDFYGNLKRGVKRADAEGFFDAATASAAWEPLSGATYYEMLDETLADSDTSYIKTITDPGGAPASTDRASWEFSDSADDIDELVVVQKSTLIRTAAGTSSVKLFTRTEGNTTPSANTYDVAIAPASAWTIETIFYPLDPRDSSAWSKAKLDTIEGGIETQDLT